MKSTKRMKTQALTLMHLDGKRKYIGTGNNIYRKVVINPTSEDDLQKFCRNYFRIYNFSLYNFIRRLISLDAVVVYSLFLTVYVFSEISQGITKKFIFMDTAISMFLNIAILVVTETLYELKHLKDIKDANSQCYLRIVPKMSHFEKVTTKDIKVGDIIRVFQGDEFPADAVILYVKNNLNAMVDSFKIDGLFRKSIKYPVDKYKIDRDYLKMLSEINGFIRCELPNKNIFCFQGNFKLDKHPRSLMLSYENFALQSSILKGAEYIDAVVVYTGADTKKNLNIPQKTEESRTFCIKMNNVVYYLIFMYLFFVLLSIIIKLTFYPTREFHQSTNDTFLTILEDFIGLYILVLPIMIYSEKSLIYIIQSLKIENNLRLKEGPNDEKPKVFNKNKNDALGAVDLLATARNGILVKKKEVFVSCAVNNVVYAKYDFVHSRGEFRLPTLNILDGERRNVAELLNLDERIFKDPESVLFPSRDLGLFLRIFQNRMAPIYNPFVDDLSMVLREKYRSYLKEEILNKNVKLTPFVKSKLNGGYNQFYENFKNNYNCKEVIEDARRGEDQTNKIEEFVLGICGCNRVIIYNEKCLDMGMREYKSENYNDAYGKYEKENTNEIENEKNEKNTEEADEENFHTIEYEDICLYNIVKNIGYHVYCYKNRLFFYNLKNQCQEYHLICFHDFLKSNKFSMCILKDIKELDKGILYVRGYDFNILPYLSLAKNDISKIKKIIKLYTMNYLKVIMICKKTIKNEDIGKYLLLKSIRNSNNSRLSLRLYDLMKIFLLNDLEVVGMIGLKNDLKEGVEDAFLDLAKFDIRSWIFTNEYSKNTYLTALECNLIASNSNLFVINFFNPQENEGGEGMQNMDNMDSGNSINSVNSANKVQKEERADNMDNMANALFNNFTLSLDKLNSTSYAIVINDASIKNIMRNAHAMKMFLSIAMRATVVLFCKMDNETKGKIIKKVLSLTTPRLTILGVGSTLNDAYLLKNTTISVCLSLNEQINVLYSISDYVLQEFRYIIDLLILGRLNKISLSRSFLWIIYLKITIVSLYFFHNFDNFFSGSSTSSILYTQTTFAVFHYLLIIAFSAYEIDLPYKFIRRVPYIYQFARRKYILNNTIIILTILEAMLISFISYYIMRVHVFPLITHRTFTFHIFILNFFITSEKILLLSRTWHLYFFTLAILIICFLFIYVNVYTLIDCLKIGKCELSLFHTEDSYFWLSLLPILYINFFIDKAAKFINNRIYPDIADYFRENILKRDHKGSSKDSTTEGNISANVKDMTHGPLNIKGNVNLKKFIPTPKQYSIRDNNTYHSRTKKTKFIYETFRKVIGINIKYRNQQLNLEYKTYEKRNKLKLRTIGIVLFAIFFIMFFAQAVISKCTNSIKFSLKTLTYFLILYYFFATVWMVFIRLRNRSNSTLFFFIGKLVLIFGFIFELYENVSNDIINMLVAYSFTVSYIFFLSFKILEGIIICTLVLVLTCWVYYEKNKTLGSMCAKFCEDPYLSLLHLQEVNISCLCKQQIVTFIICMLSFSFICLSMKYYEIYYLKKKFLFRYKQKVNLTKQIEILHTMLPSFLVEYLLISDPKADGIMVGKNISGEDRGIISVIFCDIDDFQSMVSTLQPHALVETLDNLYLYFDKCIKYFNCIKIETVFESYLAASGLSEKQNDCVHKIKYDTRCAIKLAIAQLSAKYYISYKVLDRERNNVGSDNLRHSSSYTLPVLSGEDAHYDKYTQKNISLRIGIHTGKAISGVIGSVKPQYSLFGDTVNTASRMKSTALTDHIHVSYDTYKYLEDDTSLVWKERKMFIKGKGEMRTYLLVDILDHVKKIEENSEVGLSSSTLFGKTDDMVEGEHIDKGVVDGAHVDKDIVEGGTEKLHPKKKKKQKERRYREDPQQINAQSRLIEEILDVYERESDSSKKNNWYYYNKADNASDSMKSNDIPTSSRIFNYRKSKYLSMDKLKLADTVRPNNLYDFESPVSLRKEIVGGKKESDEFFTSPYVEDKHQMEGIKKKRRSKAILRKDSSDFMNQFDTPNGVLKKYIKERRNYQRKFYAPHFYLGDLLKRSNEFKKGEKKKRAKKEKQGDRRKATHEEGVSYNFVNGSFSSNREYSTESEFYLYDDKLRESKGYINFDDLFTKIYRKKRNILQGDIQHIPKQGFLFPRNIATKGKKKKKKIAHKGGTPTK